jgi:ankyrin repeat protein
MVSQRADSNTCIEDIKYVPVVKHKVSCFLDGLPTPSESIHCWCNCFEDIQDDNAAFAKNELHEAIINNNALVIQTILKALSGREACIQQKDDDLSTPLHLCCRSYINVPQEITQLVAQANPDAISMQDEEGDTPLHVAFMNGACNDIIQTLIKLEYNSHAEDSTNNLYSDEEKTAFAKVNIEGDTPLHTAIKSLACTQSIKTLLDAYPQGLLTLNCSGQSPLHVAIENGQYDLIETIINSHASNDLGEELLKSTDDAGLTPVHMLWNQFCNLHVKYTTATITTTTRDQIYDPTLCQEIMDGIASLLLYTSSPSNISSATKSQEEEDDNYEETIVYQLFLTSLRLGSSVVPGAYVAYLIKKHPQILRQPNREGLLPLHLAIMHYHQPKEAIGPLIRYIKKKEPAFGPSTVLLDNSLMKDFDEPKSSLHENRGQIYAQFVSIVLDAHPMAAFQRDHNGKLPFHLAIEVGMPWDQLEKLMQANPHVIREEVPNSGLVPFMMVAHNSLYDSKEQVNTIFHLLRNIPDIINICKKGECMSVQHIRKKRKVEK